MSPNECSMATYARASSRTPGVAPANRVSSVDWPQEGHRLRFASLASRLGQIQTARNPGELSEWFIEARPSGRETVALPQAITSSECRPPEERTQNAKTTRPTRPTRMTIDRSEEQNDVFGLPAVGRAGRQAGVFRAGSEFMGSAKDTAAVAAPT